MSGINALMDRILNVPKPETEDNRETEQSEPTEGDNTVQQAVVEIEQPEEEEYDEPAEQIKEVVVPDDDEEEEKPKKSRNRRHHREKREDVDERKLRNPNDKLLENCEKVTTVDKIKNKVKRRHLPKEEREQLEMDDEEMRDKIENEEDEKNKRRNALYRLRYYRSKYPESIPDVDLTTLETDQLVQMGDDIADARIASSWEAIVKTGYHGLVAMGEAYGSKAGFDLTGLTNEVKGSDVVNKALEDIAVEYGYMAHEYCNPFVMLAIGTVSIAGQINVQNRTKKVLNPNEESKDFSKLLSEKEYNDEI